MPLKKTTSSREMTQATADQKMRVLCVDDDPYVAQSLELLLRRHYNLTSVSSGAEALEVLNREEPFAVVLADMRMPEMDGAAFLAEARRIAPDTTRILLTGYADLKSATSAVNKGWIFRILSKPCPPDELREAVSAAAQQYRLVTGERKRARDSLLKLTRAIEQSPVTIVITDLDANIEYANPAFSVASGYALAEAMGENPRILQSGLHPPSFYKDLWSHLLSGREWRGEICNKRKNGEIYWESALITPVRDAEGNLSNYLAVKEDITELKKRDEELRLKQRQLIQADKLASLGVMVAGVAHEINNPVNSIMLGASLLKDALADALPILDSHLKASQDALLGGLPYAEMREHLPRMLEDILDSCARIKGITEDLRDSSPVEYERTHEWTDVNKAVGKAIRMCSHMDKHFHERIDLTMSEGLPSVACSQRRLEQVLINLIQNAWQALQRHDARIIVRTGIRDDSGQIEIIVQDEGCGMPEDVLSRIKDPFFTTRRDQGGTGLGTSVSSGIIEEMGGTLTYESDQDCGTVARVLLPVGKER